MQEQVYVNPQESSNMLARYSCGETVFPHIKTKIQHARTTIPPIRKEVDKDTSCTFSVGSVTANEPIIPRLIERQKQSIETMIAVFATAKAERAPCKIV